MFSQYDHIKKKKITKVQWSDLGFDGHQKSVSYLGFKTTEEEPSVLAIIVSILITTKQLDLGYNINKN